VKRTSTLNVILEWSELNK